MKRPTLLIFLLTGSALTAALVLATGLGPLGFTTDRSASAMAEAAERFVASLGEDQRAKALFPFDDDERYDFHFIPRPRKGVPLKDLDPEQRKLAHELLKAALSLPGYEKAETIIELEDILRELEQGRGPVRDPELYYFSVFGTPGAADRWGWRVEGHHLSLNFTVVGGELVSYTPSFFGANPAEVRQGPRRGLRVLGAEEDKARALLMSLNVQQRNEAVFSLTAPADIVTGSSRKVDPLVPTGTSSAGFEERQKALLNDLLAEYVGRMPEDLSRVRWERLQSTGIDKIYFAWAGSGDRNEPHYYRLQGPTFLIEYDNTQNDANHIHSVWRDFEGDWGHDLLREHYASSPHPHRLISGDQASDVDRDPGDSSAEDSAGKGR